MQWVTVEVCGDVGRKDVFGNVPSIPLADIKEGARVEFFGFRVAVNWVRNF